jgi:hypothetical protein
LVRTQARIRWGDSNQRLLIDVVEVHGELCEVILLISLGWEWVSLPEYYLLLSCHHCDRDLAIPLPLNCVSLVSRAILNPALQLVGTTRVPTSFSQVELAHLTRSPVHEIDGSVVVQVLRSDDEVLERRLGPLVVEVILILLEFHKEVALRSHCDRLPPKLCGEV